MTEWSDRARGDAIERAVAHVGGILAGKRLEERRAIVAFVRGYADAVARGHAGGSRLDRRRDLVAAAALRAVALRVERGEHVV